MSFAVVKDAISIAIHILEVAFTIAVRIRGRQTTIGRCRYTVAVSSAVCTAILVGISTIGFDYIGDTIAVAVEIEVVGFAVAIRIQDRAAAGVFYGIRDTIIVTIEVEVIRDAVAIGITGCTRCSTVFITIGDTIAITVGFTIIGNAVTIRVRGIVAIGATFDAIVDAIAIAVEVAVIGCTIPIRIQRSAAIRAFLHAVGDAITIAVEVAVIGRTITIGIEGIVAIGTLLYTVRDTIAITVEVTVIGRTIPVGIARIVSIGATFNAIVDTIAITVEVAVIGCTIPIRIQRCVAVRTTLYAVGDAITIAVEVAVIGRAVAIRIDRAIAICTFLDAVRNTIAVAIDVIGIFFTVVIRIGRVVTCAGGSGNTIGIDGSISFAILIGISTIGFHDIGDAVAITVEIELVRRTIAIGIAGVGGRRTGCVLNSIKDAVIIVVEVNIIRHPILIVIGHRSGDRHTQGGSSACTTIGIGDDGDRSSGCAHGNGNGVGGGSAGPARRQRPGITGGTRYRRSYVGLGSPVAYRGGTGDGSRRSHAGDCYCNGIRVFSIGSIGNLTTEIGRRSEGPGRIGGSTCTSDIREGHVVGALLPLVRVAATATAGSRCGTKGRRCLAGTDGLCARDHTAIESGRNRDGHCCRSATTRGIGTCYRIRCC